MKLLVLCLLFSVLACLGSTSPVHYRGQSLYRSKLFRRSPQAHEVMYVKGQKPTGKEYNPSPPPALRKGQYMCGRRVCRLQPGEVPKGCNGMCQYAIN